MRDPIHVLSDRWLNPEGPESDIVVSSRCRLARNLSGLPFSRLAQPDQLQIIAQRIAAAVASEPSLDLIQIDLSAVSPFERAVLRESHLISPELEKQTHPCGVFVSRDGRVSIMVNEEDHLRMQAIASGYKIREVHAIIDSVDDLLSHHLTYAFSPRLGYLTACPTNTGTGLRASAMLHLPGLALAGQADRLVREVAQKGFAVRGFYGEGTNAAGDLYQISNEVTLGKSEAEIIDGLLGVIDQILASEREARQALYAQKPHVIEDSIWRSYATLSQARLINSAEAITLLSRLRLGIDRGHFNRRLTHHDLNRLLIEIQPGHLVAQRDAAGDTETRDIARANFLRGRLQDVVEGN